ncbi:hypothetical protein ACS78I_21985 [Yersinia enterocolitica]|uniref:hypothetical protein n=1 Tax=Yersinia enterocolitica TaxID=630 RepID=UPI0028B8C5A4|nr:hypothetical protein [Yersinia enterocolitica]ELI8120973.1 hypothetical protein [Yersinia enterocolitica]HDL8294578.1 hypothetical protein [Yersinia enterocolitica]
MKKLICIAGLLIATTAHAGTYADIAKAKFESEMVQAIQLTDMSDMEKTKAISRLPQAQKALREVARSGIKDKKSCLKIKKDFISEQKQIMGKEDITDKDLAYSSLAAMGDYVATVCLDMK